MRFSPLDKKVFSMGSAARFRSPKSPGSLFRRFASDRSGATAVEFAMISVPFLGLLFAIFQTAYLLMMQSAMDSAASVAARNIMTGQAMASGYNSAAPTTSGGTTTASSFATNVVCPALPSFVTCSSLIFNVTTAGASSGAAWTTANSTATNNILNSTTNNFCIGNPGDIVIVQVVYPVPAYLSIVTLGKSLNSIGSSQSGQVQQTSNSNAWVYPIMGTLAFKNEPFTASSTYTKATGC